MQRNRCPIGDAITNLDTVATDPKVIGRCERAKLSISNFGVDP
jgi:hypothetical protein